MNGILPIGSIVKIVEVPYELIIIGYLGYTNKSDNTEGRDYVACDAYKGYDDENLVLFNKSSIENVIFMGYKNDQAMRKLKMINRVTEGLKESDTIEELEKIVVGSTMQDITSAEFSSKFKAITKNKKDKKEYYEVKE